jgi:cellulose synthase (UDP-forming)
LGLENTLTPDEEVFYRQIQPIRDGVGGVICAGTSFVVRRSALIATGCFVTESLSEDYFTGIRLAAKGYRVLYLNEKLSAGLAAENISVQALQRTRWAQGTLQAFFIKTNPLTIPGLNLLQRLAHLEGLLHWFTSPARVGLLFMPLSLCVPAYHSSPSNGCRSAVFLCSLLSRADYCFFLVKFSLSLGGIVRCLLIGSGVSFGSHRD